MQLGVAARQVDRVGVGIGRLVGQRRERAQLDALAAPALEDGGVGEGEGAVVGHGDALAERRPGARVGSQDRDAGRAGQALQPVELDPLLDQLARGGQEGAEIGMLGRLDETQMPAGQGQRRLARDHAQHRRGDVLEAGTAQAARHARRWRRD